MCYRGCPYESYPRGFQEGCICRLPRGICCPLNEDCDPPSEFEKDYMRGDWEPDTADKDDI